MNGVFGFCFVNSVVIPARPAASPPDAHQVKISNCLFVAACDAGTVVATSAPTAARTIASFDFFSIQFPFYVEVGLCRAAPALRCNLWGRGDYFQHILPNSG